MILIMVRIPDLRCNLKKGKIPTNWDGEMLGFACLIPCVQFIVYQCTQICFITL